MRVYLSPVNDVPCYLLFLSVAVRAAMTAVQQDFQPWVQAARLTVFLLLRLLQPLVHRRMPALMQPFLLLSTALATGLATGLMFTLPSLDYFAPLYIALGLAANRYLSLSAIPYWLVVLCVLPAATLFLVFGLTQGKSYVLTYVAGVPSMLNRLQELRREATVKQALFRTTQEALNNVLRHAGVNAAAIDLTFGEKEVILRMSDRGCGFVPGEIPAGESVGLITMRERVEAVGREFLIRTASGGGTEIEARVPCNRGGQA